MRPPRQSNRAFGLMFTVFFLLIAGVGWYFFDVWRWALIASVCFLTTALVFPRLLLVPNLLWRRLAARLAVVNTYVILGAVFYTVISPVGFLMKLIRRDPMKRAFRTDATSYFTPVDRQVSADTLGDQF